MHNKLVIGTELDTKSFDAQIEVTKRKLEMLERYADETKMPKKIKRTTEEQQKLNVEIEKTRNELIRLQEAQLKSNRTQEEGTEKEIKKWDLNLKGLKKFALGLIGIRGLYSLARRASSAWLSQDTELTKKFQNVWLGLGAALQPVLEWLANTMMKLLGYINEFVKAFTNGKVDLVARANAIAIKKQAESMKELKNQTYGFDELNIQQVNDNKSDSSSVGGIKIPELNSNIVKIIGDIGRGLGDISRWVEKNLGVNGPITLGIAAIIGVKLLGGGTGLLGILAILILIHETLQLINALKQIKEINKTFEQNTKGMSEYNKKIAELTGNYEELAKSGEMTKEKQEQWEKSLKVLNQGIDNHSNSLAKNKGFTSKTREEQKELLKQTELLVGSYEEMAKTVGLSENASKDYLKALENQRTVMKNLGQDTGEVDKKIADLKTQIGNLGEINPKVKIEVSIDDKTKEKMNQIQKRFNEFATNVSKNPSIANILSQAIKFSTTAFGATGGVLNKCASGSIINNPGRGVYLGNNTIGGEAGKEGLIPLTDPNAMTELGETIGRYITVNLTNITKLDSKTINKENRTISNDMDFIRNGGGA